MERNRSRRMARSDKIIAVNQYLRLQERFKHVTPEQVEHLQNWVDDRWARFVQRHQLNNDAQRSQIEV